MTETLRKPAAWLVLAVSLLLLHGPWGDPGGPPGGCDPKSAITR